MLPQSYPNYKTVHRRFQNWCHNEVLRRVLTDVANELRETGALDEEECFIDATFAMAKVAFAGVGFLGLLLILRPGTSVFQPVALVGLASAGFAAVAQVGIRGMASTEPVTRIVFYFALIATSV